MGYCKEEEEEGGAISLELESGLDRRSVIVSTERAAAGPCVSAPAKATDEG